MVEQKVCCLLFSLILACPVGSVSAASTSAGGVTKMSIKVDLQCRKCYKKIKKVLSSFPEIRDQAYDVKENTVIITVVCCSPEKIRDMICCKGGNIILCIEIITGKPQQVTEKKETTVNNGTVVIIVNEQPKEKTPPPCPTLPPCPKPLPCPTPPPCKKPCEPPSCSVGVCSCPPCNRGCGPPPPICGDGCGKPPACKCPGGNRGYCGSRCDYCFIEEDPTGCSIM